MSYSRQILSCGTLENLDRQCFYSVVQFARPGGPTQNIGVLLYDAERGNVFLRFRPTNDYSDMVSDDDLEVLGLIEDDLRTRFREADPLSVVRHLEDTLSNVVLISERNYVPAPDDPERLLDTIFRTVILEQ